jgi:hypothetical protein
MRPGPRIDSNLGFEDPVAGLGSFESTATALGVSMGVVTRVKGIPFSIKEGFKPSTKVHRSRIRGHTDVAEEAVVETSAEGNR